MNDPKNEELISAYLDGELSTEEQAQVERLLAESPELRRWCDEMGAMRSRLQAMPRKRLGTDFAAGIAERARQALEDQQAPAQPASITPLAPAAAPATKSPVAPPAAAAPKKDEPEVAPARWSFANLNPRMVFWPLAALAAGLAMMVFVPGEKETPVARNSEAQSEREAKEGYTSFSDTYGIKKAGSGDGQLGAEADKNSNGLFDNSFHKSVKNADGDFDENSPARPKTFDGPRGPQTSNGGRGSDPASGPADPSDLPGLSSLGAEFDAGVKKMKGVNGEFRELGTSAGETLVVEVTVPYDQWEESSENSYALSLSRKQILLADLEGLDDQVKLNMPAKAEYFRRMTAAKDSLRDIPSNELKAIAHTWRVKGREEDSKSEWYYVAANPQSLKAVFHDLQTHGSRVVVKNSTYDREKGLGKELNEVAQLHRELDRLEQVERRSGIEPGDRFDGVDPLRGEEPLSLSKTGEERTGKRSEAGVLFVPPPPTIVLGPQPEPTIVAGVVPVGPPPGPAAVVPATLPVPTEKIPEDKLPLSVTESSPSLKPGERPGRKPADSPPSRGVNEYERLAELGEGEARYGYGNWNGRAYRLRYKEVNDELAARDGRVTALGVSQGGAGKDQPTGGGNPGAGPAIQTTKPVQTRPEPPKAESPIAGNLPPPAQEPAGVPRPMDDTSDFQDRKEGGKLLKLRPGEVRVVVVFRRGLPVPAPPASVAPAAQKVSPETKK